MGREVPQLEGEREDKRQDKQPAGGLPSSRMLRNGILISVALSVIALTIISLLTMDRRTFDALRSLRPLTWPWPSSWAALAPSGRLSGCACW